MDSNIYVTGTDTEIGKTFVTVRLIDDLKATRCRVQGMKPIASGATRSENGLRNEDALALQRISSDPTTPYGRVNPFVFEEAIAPEFAARNANQHVTLTPIINAFEKLQRDNDIVVVEGFGGWLSPINAELDQEDIVKALNLRVVLTVGIKLGCNHHARATVQAIAQSGVQLIGWIANEGAELDACFEDNVEAIRRYIDAPLLATVRANQERVGWIF